VEKEFLNKVNVYESLCSLVYYVFIKYPHCLK